MGGNYGNSMMGGWGAGRWMMGAAGYRWMFGGAGAPRWMRCETLPGGMMGTGADPGKFMDRLWAAAPGPRVGPGQAGRLGNQIPPGAHINRAARTIVFTAGSVHLAALAGPAGGPEETFRIAGMVNPKVIVPAGAHISIEVINADPGTAHGLVITRAKDRWPWMPMMTSRPAFPGSAVWFLGNPATAGMHAGTLTFTAATPGTYRYLCPVPGHAEQGMQGTFIVAAGS